MRRLTHSYPARFLVVVGAVVAAIVILGLHSLARLCPRKQPKIIQ